MNKQQRKELRAVQAAAALRQAGQVERLRALGNEQAQAFRAIGLAMGWPFVAIPLRATVDSPSAHERMATTVRGLAEHNGLTGVYVACKRGEWFVTYGKEAA